MNKLITYFSEKPKTLFLIDSIVEYTFNNEVFFNLFDFYYFQDAIKEFNEGEYLRLPDNVVAKKLYDYAMNDA